MTRELLQQAEMRSKGRLLKRLVVVGMIALALAGSVFAAGLIVYVFPELDEPAPSDAVIVLGPPTVQRLVTAQNLVDEGLAERMVISVPPGVEDDPSHPRLRNLCSGTTNYEVECLTPDPFTTQGEARLTRRLMADNGWSSVMVVTSVSHVSRARVLFDRCIDETQQRVRFLSDGRDYDLKRWVDEFFYQSGAFVKVALSPQC